MADVLTLGTVSIRIGVPYHRLVKLVRDNPGLPHLMKVGGRISAVPSDRVDDLRREMVRRGLVADTAVQAPAVA